MTEQRTNERRIEQQLDEFRAKWKKEIQQRTVYGHVIEDEQTDQHTIDNEEQVERDLNNNLLFFTLSFLRRNISSFAQVI